MSASWTSVPDATGYTLFYAPYPDANSIGQIDMGTETSISFDGHGFAFYVAIQSYNNSGSSGYSNIEFFNIEYSIYNISTDNPGVWRVSKIEYDTNMDGVIDLFGIYTYNQDGNFLTSEEAQDITYYTYNAVGKLIAKYEEDDDSTYSAYEYTYDSYGNMVKEVYGDNWSHENNYIVDAYGNYSQKIQRSSGSSVQWQTNVYYDINNYSYDSNNQPIRIEDVDMGMDLYITYDQNGNVVKQETQYSNGNPETIYNYNSQGNITDYFDYNDNVLLRSKFYSYDNAPTNTYDRSYTKLRWEENCNAWSLPYYPAKYHRFPSMIEEDNDGDGLMDAVEYYTFNSNDLPEKIEYDTNNDGNIDAVQYTTWIK